MFKTITKPRNIAATIFLVVLIWMISGIFKEKKHNDIVSTNKTVKYKSITSLALNKAPSLRLNGTVIAKKNVPLYPQSDGKVVKVFVKSGQILKAGSPIIAMESKNKNEVLQKAQKNLKSIQLNYDSVLALYNKDLASKIDLDNAITTLENAKSDLALANTDLAHIIVRAPFDGYVDYINVHEGNVLQFPFATDSSVANYVSLDDMVVHVYLSEQERSLIGKHLEKSIEINKVDFKENYNEKDSKTKNNVKSKSSTADLKIDRIQDAQSQNLEIGKVIYDNKEYVGKLRFLSKVIDNTNNSFLLELGIDNKSQLLMNGQTVEVVLYGQAISSHLVPQSALILNEKGNALTVKVINNQEVKSYDVVVLDESEEGVWIHGLPDKAEVITVGQAYIEDGKL